jgi:hypothetical protein
MRSLALALLTAAALAACGSDSPSAAPTTNLVVRVDPDGANGPKPAKEARLRATSLTPRDLAATPPGRACTEIYGGPQTATIKGTLKGEPVDARFSRTDGCQIARWQRVRAVLARASK